MTIRVAVADDHEFVRAGFTTMLLSQPGITVVGDAVNGDDAVRLCQREQIDVLLMDIRMPGLDGIEATRQITAAGDRPRVIMLTTFDLDEYVYDALGAGASGFLLKDITAEDLAAAVRVVAAGEALLAPGITKRLIAEVMRLRPRKAVHKQLEQAALTRREVDTLLLIAEGISNAEIAARLSISEETVKTHVSRVLIKLDLRDRTQAVVYAYETGLVNPRS
ncbi:MAG TPA: response regulator transcription factor [Candidatus Limnocylindrales bacterium]|nr:response regulator transcription factor [Candidatus Limnocylindrales bacterium]